ncbi:MAG TPA: PspC domain-containing protein, partial [Spirochaetia bacterium]|nr:PspC domain-containing protein [Spirochaetia bacterium]
MDAKRPLRRSRTNRMIGGVVGGLADYIGMDPVLARVLYVLIAVF